VQGALVSRELRFVPRTEIIGYSIGSHWRSPTGSPGLARLSFLAVLKLLVREVFRDALGEVFK
jgi:hypothetical protein